MPQNAFSPRTRDLLVSQKTKQKHFFPTLHPLSPLIFATACTHTHTHTRTRTHARFAILGSTSIVIHSVKQRLLRNRPGSALRPFATSCAKDYKGQSLVQTSFTEPPICLQSERRPSNSSGKSVAQGKSCRSRKPKLSTIESGHQMDG